MLLFHISLDFPEVALAEIQALMDYPDLIVSLPFIVVDQKYGPILTRLSCTRLIHEVLFTSSIESINGNIKNFDWKKVFNPPLCVRVFPKDSVVERQLAKQVYDLLDSPKINLTAPKTSFYFLKKVEPNEKVTVYATKLIQALDQKFDSRKSHHRLASAPISMHPKLARAFVNLTGIKDGVLLDPFCGTGGILLEAAVMGLETVGVDCEEKMVLATKKNLVHFGKSPILHCQDSFTLDGNFPFVATDVPYGRNTTPQDLDPFWNSLMKKLGEWNTVRAVIGVPSTFDPIIPAGFEKIGECIIYIHQSLSKKVIVLERI